MNFNFSSCLLFKTNIFCIHLIFCFNQFYLFFISLFLKYLFYLVSNVSNEHKTPDMCITAECKNMAISHPEWDNEYCSISCCYNHCKYVFACTIIVEVKIWFNIYIVFLMYDQIKYYTLKTKLKKVFLLFTIHIMTTYLLILLCKQMITLQQCCSTF